MKNKKLKVVENTCFSLHEKHKVECQRKSCSSWIPYETNKNCAILASKAGPKTLQEIGKIYNLTRMRICQIEKNIYEKIRNIIKES